MVIEHVLHIDTFCQWYKCTDRPNISDHIYCTIQFNLETNKLILITEVAGFVYN